ncbi:MAG: four helix bundle protein [Nitrospiraceae bacterium]|nr:four helix bundle protein [Nitrospiraceae bacterium]
MKDHKDLDVWKVSMDLVMDIYQATGAFPREEQYGLTGQLRRAAILISSNISEGAARNTEKEFIQFLDIASGSASELETQLIIAHKLKYISEIDALLEKVTSVKKLFQGLIRYYKKKVIRD